MHLRQKLLGNTRTFSPADEGAVAPAPQTPAGDPPAAPPATPPAAVASEPVVTPAGDPPPAPQPKADWKLDRIAELTAKLNKERIAREKAEAAAPPPPPVAPVGGLTQAEIDAAINARARELTQQERWNESCNAVAEAGAKQYSDFPARLAAAQSVLDPGDAKDMAAWNGLIETAIETGEAHKIIYQLGGNPGEVKRLMGLSPVKQAMEITKMAQAQARGGAPDPSGAPAPITPIGSQGIHYDGITPDNPTNGMKLPIKDWMAMREKQAASKGIQ